MARASDAYERKGEEVKTDFSIVSKDFTFKEKKFASIFAAKFASPHSNIKVEAGA